MNVQRWIALGMFVLSVVCMATSNLWLAPMLEEDEEETPTPTATEVLEISEEELAQTASPTPTLNPIVAEMVEEGVQAAASNFPIIVYAGDFTRVDSLYGADGTATIWQTGEFSYVLRLDPFEVTNGPDLHVYLSRQESPRTSSATLDNSIDLGLLQSIDEAQNLEIPDATRLQDYKSVVIYSVSLQLVFSSAELVATRGGTQ